MGRIIEEAEEYKLQLFAEGYPPPARDLPSGRFPAPAPRTFDQRPDDGAIEIADVIAAAAVHAASKLADSRIVAFSQGGFAARRLARYRPAVPTLVFTLEHEVQHRRDLVQVVERELLARKLIRRGECMILLMGHPIEERPLTNLLRIHRIAGAPRG
jgi:pyruvate kinase